MPASACYRPVHIKPVTGFLDTRSNPDEVPFGGYRMAKNVEVTQKLKLCRAVGFTRMQDKIDYNNEDLHDQLYSYTRQPIQFLFEAETPEGFSKLFAGTQNRLYAKSNSTGNWAVISDLLGGTPVVGCSDAVRWTAGVVGQTVVLSNGMDRPMSHIIDQPFLGDDQQAVQEIRDLTDLNVTQVSIVYAWRDIMILFNVVQDGGRFSDRIIWSDLQQPLSFKEDIGVSLAGFKDLGAGETILGVAPLRDSLMVYTTKGIWEMRVVGGDAVFSFGKRYAADKAGARCLAYPNTLVSDGAANYYFGEDGIWKYDLSLWDPVLVDWIHRASSLIFDDLDESRCLVPHGGYQSTRRQIWWSWTKHGEDCPSQTLVINTEFPFASFYDHGFTAFTNHLPDTNKSIRDWLVEQCICTYEELPFVKEGGYCTTKENPTCDVTPANFYSSNTRTEDEIASEDWAGEPDEDSLWTILGDVKLLDLCAAEFASDQCNADKLFAMASSADYSLKQYANVYYRERCTSHVGCGSYIKEGYRSLLRSGPMDLKLPDDDKQISRFAIDLFPTEQTIPSQLILRIGVSAQPLDPNVLNSGRNVILWEEQDVKDLIYQGEATEIEHRRDNTRPGTELEWGLFLSTRWIYFEVEIVNTKVNPPDTGGGCCISRWTFDAKADPRCT